MAQFLGIIDIVWRGVNIPVDKGAKYRPGGIQNNVVTTGRKVGRSQEFIGAEITATSHFEKGQRWGNTWDPGEGELQLLCDSGQTFVHNDAFLTEIPEIDEAEGSFDLKWAASPGEEIL